MTADRIVFLTGVSGAGKTTLSAELGEREGVEAFDVDVHAVERPNVAHLDWLRWRHAEYLHEATGDEHDGKTVVVSGICLPNWLIDSNAWHPAQKAKLDIFVVMLYPTWKVTKERILARIPDAKRTQRKALVDYNKGLRRKMHDQVMAYRQGVVYLSNDDLSEVPEYADEIVCGL